MIVGATLLCDRKRSSPMPAIQYLIDEPLIDKIYVNIETVNSHWFDIEDKLAASGKPYDIDYWYSTSTWLGKPQYDQDSPRFLPIARGRNMAADWATVQSMSYDVTNLLFVDSDVRPHPGGLQHLINLNKPLAGGLVPGRGAHRNARYIFGIREQHGNVIACDHGTSGYLLIHRDIFQVLRFRSGPCVYKREVSLCDDPAYATDAFHFGFTDAWYIDVRATADHLDNPDKPLTMEGAINNYSGVP